MPTPAELMAQATAMANQGGPGKNAAAAQSWLENQMKAQGFQTRAPQDDLLAQFDSTQGQPSTQPAPQASGLLSDFDNTPTKPQDVPQMPSQQNDPQYQALFGQPTTMDKVLQGVKDFGQAELHHIENIPVGLAQLGAHIAKNSPLAPGIALAEQISGKPIYDQSVGSLDNAVRQREQQYQASVPNTPAAYAGAAAGEVLPWLTGSGEMSALGKAAANVLPKAAPAWLARAAGAAAQGATVGAAQPVTAQTGVGGLVEGQPTTFAQEKLKQIGLGAGTGGAMDVGLSGLGAAARGVRNLVNPQSGAAQFIASRAESPNLAQNMQGAQELVPGSQPTSAQVAQSPAVVQIEKSLGSNFPEFKTAQVQREIQNNQARWDVLNKFAGTDDQMNQALAARQAKIAPMVDKLITNGKPVDVTGTLESIGQLQSKGLGTDPLVKKTLQSLQNEIINDPTASFNPSTKQFTIAPERLDGYRTNLRNLIADQTPDGIVPTRAEKALSNVKSSMVNDFESANPGYADYVNAYREASVPINTMARAREIVDNLSGGPRNAGTTAPQITLGRFNTQLKKALNSDYGVSPDAESALKGIQQDLQRESVSNSIRFPGSDTRYNFAAGQTLSKTLNNPIARLVGGGLGALTGGPTGALGGYLGAEKLSNVLTQRGNKALADLLMNPEKLSEILQRTPQVQSSRVPLISQTLQKLSR